MKKILFITPSIGYGGAEKQLAILAKSLNAKGFNSYILSLKHQKKEMILPEFNNLNVIETKIKYKFSWLYFFHLKKIVKKINPDIVQGWMYSGNIVTSILTIGYDTKKIFHSIRASNMDSYRYGRQIFLNGFLSRFANKVVVNSQAGFNFHQEKFFFNKNMIVIRNGIDTQYFKPDLNLRQITRKSLGIKSNKKVIIYVARMDPMKAHDKVLQIASLYPTIIFLIVGSKTNEIKGLKNVIGLGVSDEMPSLYNAADMMISLSNYGEGFPNVIGEAMSCGIPVMANNIGDSKKIIGTTGIILDINNLTNLNEKINYLLDLSKLKNKKMQIRNHIISNFSISSMIDSYLKLYKEFL